MKMKAIKVSELNKYLKKHIAMDYILSDIEVEGEISNLKYHTNGNIYLSLKDECSKINAMVYVMDADGIDFKPSDGDKVIAKGSVSLFEKDASVKLFIRSMNLKGLGDLHERFIKLKEKLYKEGLFDDIHKKDIKYFPKEIGVITSPTGAAIRDIINVLKRRNSAVNIVLYPSLVQGDNASENLINGIRYFNENPVDTIIIGRGGGGYEDLFCFNDETLAREIFKSKIPVISAVGHEIDYVISDFVSDMRAPTPSAAAEIVSMSKYDLENRLDQSFNRMNAIMIKLIEDKSTELCDIEKFLNMYLFNEIEKNRKEVSVMFNSINRTVKYKIELEKNLLKLTYKSLLRNNSEKTIAEKRIELENIFKDVNILKRINRDYELLEQYKYLLDRNIKYFISEKKTQLSGLREALNSPVNNRVYIRDTNGKVMLSASDFIIGENINILFDDGEVQALVNKIVKE